MSIEHLSPDLHQFLFKRNIHQIHNLSKKPVSKTAKYILFIPKKEKSDSFTLLCCWNFTNQPFEVEKDILDTKFISFKMTPIKPWKFQILDTCQKKKKEKKPMK